MIEVSVECGDSVAVGIVVVEGEESQIAEGRLSRGDAEKVGVPEGRRRRPSRR